MTRTFVGIFILLFFISCSSKQESPEVLRKNAGEGEFDPIEWNVKEGDQYIHRKEMYKTVLYNDTIRNLNKDQLISILGEPDYIRDNHFYYRINESKLLLWKLHTRTMVVKMDEKEGIEWIKLHE